MLLFSAHQLIDLPDILRPQMLHISGLHIAQLGNALISML